MPYAVKQCAEQLQACGQALTLILKKKTPNKYCFGLNDSPRLDFVKASVVIACFWMQQLTCWLINTSMCFDGLPECLLVLIQLDSLNISCTVLGIHINSYNHVYHPAFPIWANQFMQQSSVCVSSYFCYNAVKEKCNNPNLVLFISSLTLEIVDTEPEDTINRRVRAGALPTF